MTSKNLFFKLIWQDFKKRIWCPIIIFIAYFLCMEIQLLNYIDRMERYPSDFDYTIKHYIANNFFSPDMNSIIIYMTAIVAAVCALSGYAYLHSRKQLDTYHSMPVKREVLFFSRYISGLIMFVIPFALHVLFCILIAITNGAFSGHGLVNAIGFLGIQILCFLLTYSLCIVVVCLTGNMIISILGSCVLVGYDVILSALIELLYETFFHTHLGSFKEQMWTFSPVGMLAELYMRAEDYRELNSGFSYQSVLSYTLVILLAILVYTVIGVFLYHKRATEAAGKPIAFAITEPFIKSIVVLPISIYCGFFIQDIANANSFGWFLFGIIFGFVVFALVMEIIFRLDIKCVFHHWKQLIFNGICLALIVTIFKYDVMGYNTYVPNEQELTGCAVSVEGLMDIDQQDYTQRNRYRYVSAMDYRFEHMNIVDNPSALELAKKAASEGLRLTEYDYYEGIEESPEYQEMLEREENYRSISFKFTKENGKNVYRQYFVDISDEETLRLLADIFADSNYKLGAFPILTNGWKKEYSEVICLSNDFSDSVKLSPERQARLLEVYQSEMVDLTLDEVMNVVPLGNITFQQKGYSKNSYGGYEEGYKIYPQFTATIELLKEYGFDYTEKLSPEQVKEVEVSRYYEDLFEEELLEETYEAKAVAVPAYSNEVVLEYTDQDSKEAILSSIVNRELFRGVTNYLDMEDDDDNVVVYYDMDGIEESGNYQFYVDKKPEFIEKDFEKKLEEVKKELYLGF